MTTVSARVPQKPHAYVAPVRPPTISLAQADRLRRTGRCAGCRGALWVDPPTTWPGTLACLHCGAVVAEVLDELPPPRPPLSPEELRPKRGRPPKAAPRVPTTPPCSICNRRRAKPGRSCCQACAASRAQRPGTQGYFPPLLALLETGTALRCGEIASALGCAPDTVRHVICRARERGVPIVRTRGRRYALEGVAS